MRDALTEAMNAPAGKLARVLVKKIGKGTAADGNLTPEMRQRFDKLVDAPGRSGFLARVRLAAEVSLLFDRAPAWTRAKIVPLFEWTNPDAGAVWAARKYAHYIGSPELFDLTKPALLEMFRRGDVPTEDLTEFAKWLTVVMIANRQCKETLYSLTEAEVRAVLRRAGEKVLPSVAHRLAIEMQQTQPEEKAARWRSVVGPVFKGIWPLDLELQTSASTFNLTQILRAAGEAFPEAYDVIIPYIRPNGPRTHSTVFSIAEEPEAFYASAPRKVLDLLAAVVGDAPPNSTYSLEKALARLKALDPSLSETRPFQKLLGSAARDMDKAAQP